MESGLNKNQIIAELARSPHRDLKQYVPMGMAAARQEPEFLARLIAWNAVKGEVRDSKTALPVVTLAAVGFPDQFVENSLAHLAMLSPRHLVQAWRFAKEIKTPLRGMQIKRLIERYLRAREARPRWDRWAIQHRGALKTLYSVAHVAPNPIVDSLLFKGARPPGSIWADVASLGNMVPQEAAAAILKWQLPFVVVAPALGKRLREPAILMAMIERMTPSELVNNSKMLDCLGVRQIPEARAAYDAAIGRAAKRPNGNSLKVARAVEEVEDEALKSRLRTVQARRIASNSIEGNWLVLGDKSGSMQEAIESSRMIAATLATHVKGRVYLVFFDSAPRCFDVTGKPYDRVIAETGLVMAAGATSVGCGVQWALDSKLDVDGIAIVSDGGENAAPAFATTYGRLTERLGKEIPVYFYLLQGSEGNILSPNMERAGIAATTFDLRSPARVDLYSLPNLVQTMRASRYSLINEILDWPLLTLADVFGEGDGVRESVLTA